MALPEFEPRGGDEVTIPITIGDEKLYLTRQNTVLRLFSGGNCIFDHCVYITPEGNRYPFRPAEPLREQLEQYGFAAPPRDTIDEATMKFFSTIMLKELDEQPPEDSA